MTAIQVILLFAAIMIIANNFSYIKKPFAKKDL